MKRFIFWACVNIAALWLLTLIVMAELSAWDIALAHQPAHWWGDRVCGSLLGIATLLIGGVISLTLKPTPPPAAKER